jgi:hypothetical protein
MRAPDGRLEWPVAARWGGNEWTTSDPFGPLMAAAKVTDRIIRGD